VSALHLIDASDGPTRAVAYILAALLLVAVFEAVTVAVLIASKRKTATTREETP
jgi:hypothetical protein